MFVELLQTLKSLPFEADWIGIRAVREQNQFRTVRDRLLDKHGTVLSQGVMVEVLVRGQVGYGAVNSLARHRILEAAQTAYRQALAAEKWNLCPTPIASRSPQVGHYHSSIKQPLDTLNLAEIVEVLSQICRTLKVSDRIVQTVAELTLSDVETWFVSSNGAEIYQKFSRIATNYQATAQDGAIVQSRSDNGWMARCYQGGLEFFVQDDLWARVQKIGEQAVELLDAPECPTETTTLVLSPDQMLLQIHESIGHPLELDRILGDERNYAGGSFVKPEDFGSLVYGSPHMNVTFDPRLAHEFASYAFDDVGGVAEMDYLIRDGILLRGLGGLESQARLQVPGVATTRSNSWNRPPIDRMGNLNLEPGHQSFDQLISGIERGIYMESNRSWSIDDQRHKFQFSCEYGKLIENGQMTRTLRNPNYRGTTPQFWGSLVGVGDRESWRMYGTPSCGKGEPSQLITVGHASPMAVFSDVNVMEGDMKAIVSPERYGVMTAEWLRANPPRLDPTDLEAALSRAIDWLQGQRSAHEQFTLSLIAESSQFWRFNHAKVRQAGQITDAKLKLTWMLDRRSSYYEFPLSGDWDCDQVLLSQALSRLRLDLPQLPENPYLAVPEGDRTSHESYGGRLLEPEALGDAILGVVGDLDFVGIYASGWAVRAYADSIGQSHWFLNNSFSLDYSLFSPNGQAVKGIYAGECWNQRMYEQTIQESRLQLQRLDRSPHKIRPGHYRTYLAPSAMPELVNMMSWGGVSEADLQQSGSWMLAMRNDHRTLSPQLTLNENFARGTVPRFNNLGEIAPEELVIIGQGTLENSLISSRTAKKYGLIANGASQEEGLRAPEIKPGRLPTSEVFSALDTGIYVSNLHYLNWSDRPQGRVTGMTRYACFWVEDGEIVAPIEHLRFDDSFYRFWGENLLALTDTQTCIPNIDTYGHRHMGALWTPGMLIEDFTYTL